MNSSNLKSKVKKRGYAAAGAIFFSLAVWFAFLGIYLRNSIINYKPPPDGVQEGDMVSAFLMMLLFGAAVFSLIVSFTSLLIYLLNRYRSSETV